MEFATLTLAEPILRALREEGYSVATPIQAKAIPPALEGRDLLGVAQTGTGKTAAFALPILQRLAAKAPPAGVRRPIRCLVLTPTRELATQVGDSFRAYGRHLKLTTTVIFGGVGQRPQEDALRRGVDIVVACPGRLLDLRQQGFVKLDQVECFVLDEADRMLDMGFIQPIRQIVADIPRKRQTLFFSATMPKEIRLLADSLLTDPVEVAVAPVSSTADTVAQQLYFVAKSDKQALLEHLLKTTPAISRALVFSRTKHGADRVVRNLEGVGIRAEAIHGNQSQNARTRALENFRKGTSRILVASDIAARGLDIDEITHVINYDLPNEPETYVHRIGRTGRAGASGAAISFCDGEERAYLRDIERIIRKPVPVVADHPFAAGANRPAPASAPQQRGGARFGGGRRDGGGERRFGGGGERRQQGGGFGGDRRGGERQGGGERRQGDGGGQPRQAFGAAGGGRSDAAPAARPTRW
jgi:ATP-dependent RNA helicase RhlE